MSIASLWRAPVKSDRYKSVTRKLLPQEATAVGYASLQESEKRPIRTQHESQQGINFVTTRCSTSGEDLWETWVIQPYEAL